MTQTLRTTPPKGMTYISWCNDCEAAVSQDEGSCQECASLNLVYFVKESQHQEQITTLKSAIHALNMVLEGKEKEILNHFEIQRSLLRRIDLLESKNEGKT